ncbi:MULTISPECIES: lipopolysaccharide assembly protein LapB [unclassified Lentimicrobium]|uniref:tetratricopeptide repeat protein n=1 Tax=unclassified Lentimicrobium TaxID=2677434 RepID=UPI00155225BB|nr:MULTISPECIES: hypothetical protein [unclassified Lentimicrobium]NPD44466.1 hypothetical protein [Lentimicrobium sp. S6]NPD84234.1 hypothetical protein [Lentimicrobium sp. L6]
MKRNIFYYLLLITVIFTACGTPKQTIDYQQLAMTSYEGGAYQQSIDQWNTYIQEQETKVLEVNPKAYAEIAKAQFAMEQYEKAEQNFDKARHKEYADADMYVMMVERYRMIDNLSKELTALEYYKDHFADQKDSTPMRNRLFETYMEADNYEAVTETWQKMDNESKSEEVYVQLYFDLNKELEQTEKCDELAEQLLVFNGENEEALIWLAKKYYNRAENRYQTQMDKYNKNRSNKQYNILLKQLDIVTADFKKSLKYFEPLWNMEDGKKYASYMANIYGRFDDKKKSQYYKSFIK